MNSIESGILAASCRVGQKLDDQFDRFLRRMPLQDMRGLPLQGDRGTRPFQPASTRGILLLQFVNTYIKAHVLIQGVFSLGATLSQGHPKSIQIGMRPEGPGRPSGFYPLHL